MLGQEGHMWRAKDYASFMPFTKHGHTLDIETIPGEHNNGAIAKVYHKALMTALEDIKYKGPGEVHKFLINEHPFYSEGWFEKSPTRRKIESMVKVSSWFGKGFRE